MIKMIGLDLDGTFLDSDKQIPQENIEAVTEALRRGIVVLPVTGRPFHAIPEEILRCAPFRYCIASGGAGVYDLETGEVLLEKLIPTPLAKEVADVLVRNGFLVNAFFDGTGYINEQDVETAVSLAPTEASKRYIRMFREPVPDIMALFEGARGCEKLTAASPRDKDGNFSRTAELLSILAPYEERLCIMGNTEINFEMQAEEAQKGKIMLALADMLGIRQEETMAVGDSGNDLEMVQTAGVGVAMANSYGELLEAADFVTLDNDHAGVAYAIRKLAL